MVYGFPEKTQIACPFCGDPINVLWIPEARRPRKASWGGQATYIKTRSEEYLVQNNCPTCNKTIEEIQRVLDSQQKEKNKRQPSIIKYSFTGKRK